MGKKKTNKPMMNKIDTGYLLLFYDPVLLYDETSNQPRGPRQESYGR